MRTWQYNCHLTDEPAPNYLGILITCFDKILTNVSSLTKKQRERYAPVNNFNKLPHYIFSMIASPNSEHFSSLAPSIRRSKS